MITIKLPGSKSIAARALVCRLLGGHDTILTNLPDCGDTRGMLRLTKGVREALKSGQAATVDIGEGGTTLRFGMAACASIPGLDITLIGSPRLMERPHAPLIDALIARGAELTPLPGRNAIHIRGKQLHGGEISPDGSISSQYLSALMLAAPTWQTPTLFRIAAPVVSTPYIRMTAGVMRAFGAEVSLSQTPEGMTAEVAATGYAQCARYDVEGDWSGASYFYEAQLLQKALCGKETAIQMPTLKAPAESLQGDSRVAEIFASASGHSSESTPYMLNLNDAPDLTPAVAVGLTLAGIHFRIDGIGHLRHKESDRMAAISTELRRLGYAVETGDDYMAYSGQRTEGENAPTIRTYKDHRMAMAFAPARLIFPDLRFEDEKVVEKSFPSYWEEIGKMMLKD